MIHNTFFAMLVAAAAVCTANSETVSPTAPAEPAAAAEPAAPAAAEDVYEVAATASLKDGSTIKGVFLTDSITGATLFAPELSLDPAIVKSLAFSGSEGAAKVELANNDKFAMTVANDAFAIKSILGELKIPRTGFRTIEFVKRRVSSCAAGDPALLFHCTFDDAQSITSPKAGPGGTVLSREFVPGKVNGAVRVPAGGSAGCFTIPAGTLRKEGCIEFWAKIEPRNQYYGDCDPRFIVMSSPRYWFTVEYSSNNGEGCGGFNVRCFGFSYHKGGSFGRGYKYSEVVGDASDWHHYAFSWTEDSLTTYIDGKMLDGMVKYRDGRIDEAVLSAQPFTLGLPNTIESKGSEPRSAFTIDELKIWGEPKSDFDL